MSAMDKLMDRARDELFSHINRCGVLHAVEDDQRIWMDETIEYIAERYPDLNDQALKKLYDVGMRFCKPAIPHGKPDGNPVAETAEPMVEVPQEADATAA